VEGKAKKLLLSVLECEEAEKLLGSFVTIVEGSEIQSFLCCCCELLLRGDLVGCVVSVLGIGPI